MEQIDPAAEAVARSLTDRLGMARARSGNMKQDGSKPSAATHRAIGSDSTMMTSLDITDDDAKKIRESIDK